LVLYLFIKEYPIQKKKKKMGSKHSIEDIDNNYTKNVSILIVGCGESGKTTIFKQLQYFQTDDTLVSKKYAVYNNLIDSAKTICEYLINKNIEFSTTDSNY
jgi:hypothetical protein